MPSTEDIQAQNSKETSGKDVNNTNQNECRQECTDTSNSSSPVRHSPPNKLSSTSLFQLGNKIKRETRKLIGYPGKAMKRSLSNEVNFGDNDHEPEENVIVNRTHQASDVQVDGDFSSYFKEHDILMEFKYLSKNPPSGVYVVPSTKSLQVWHGIIFLKAGPFRDGVFRFDILFQDNFPNVAPLIRFTSYLFHPQINKNGVLNIEQAFPCWNKENHIGDVLKYVKSCFYNLNTGRALNEEAATCLNENLEDFKRKARLCVERSLEEFERESPVTSEDDGNCLKVRTFSSHAIEEWKKKILGKVNAEYVE